MIRERIIRTKQTMAGTGLPLTIALVNAVPANRVVTNCAAADFTATWNCPLVEVLAQLANCGQYCNEPLPVRERLTDPL